MKTLMLGLSLLTSVPTYSSDKICRVNIDGDNLSDVEREKIEKTLTHKGYTVVDDGQNIQFNTAVNEKAKYSHHKVVVNSSLTVLKDNGAAAHAMKTVYLTDDIKKEKKAAELKKQTYKTVTAKRKGLDQAESILAEVELGTEEKITQARLSSLTDLPGCDSFHRSL